MALLSCAWLKTRKGLTFGLATYYWDISIMQNKDMQYGPKASMNFSSQQNGSIAPSNLDLPGYFLKIPGASIAQSEDISFEPPGYMFLRVLLPDAVPLRGEQRLWWHPPCPLGHPTLDATYRWFRSFLHRCWPAKACQSCCHFRDTWEMSREKGRAEIARGIFGGPYATAPPLPHTSNKRLL